MSTHCQLFANPQSIHLQFIANRVRIQFKSIVNPCQYKSTLMPIHCQSSVNLLPIQVNPPPMRHKSSQSTNLTFQCLFVTNPPIRKKFANSFHFSQSIADPMAIQTQSRTNPLSILCQSRSTHLQSSANLLAIWINPFPIRQSINSIL